MRKGSVRTCWESAAGVGLLGLMLLGASCGLDKQTEPDLVGPSDAGVSVDLVAEPDTVNADGVSQVSVRLVLRNDKGHPLSGRPILFSYDGDGRLFPAAGTNYVGPVQTGLVMATDGAGVTNVVYVAGTGIGSVIVGVRPYGTDTSFGFYRTVEIWQR